MKLFRVVRQKGSPWGVGNTISVKIDGVILFAQLKYAGPAFNGHSSLRQFRLQVTYIPGLGNPLCEQLLGTNLHGHYEASHPEFAMMSRDCLLLPVTAEIMAAEARSPFVDEDYCWGV